MNFYQVDPALREGKKIKLSTWKNAYWYMKEGNVLNHFEEGMEAPIGMLATVPLVAMLVSDKWEIVEEVKEPTVNYFSFSKALVELKKGKKVARHNWNGKGMFLVLCPGNEVPADRMRVKGVKQFYKQEGHAAVKIAPHIDLKAADGTYVTGWLASQTDMLADDWFVVE